MKKPRIIEYIDFRAFLKDFFDFKKETVSIMNDVKEILKAANHRPFLASSNAHQTFKKDTLTKILKLQADYPTMNWDQEINFFKD